MTEKHVFRVKKSKKGSKQALFWSLFGHFLSRLLLFQRVKQGTFEPDPAQKVFQNLTESGSSRTRIPPQTKQRVFLEKLSRTLFSRQETALGGPKVLLGSIQAAPLVGSG